MRLSPSVQRYVDDPDHYHLQMQGDTLHAIEGKVAAIGHEILFPQLQELKGLIDEPLAQNVLTAIRNEQFENRASLFSRIWGAVTSLLGSSLPDLETNLHEWCEEKIGTPEYTGMRIKAAKRIQQCYLEKWSVLSLNGFGLTTLPSSIGNLTALEQLHCTQNRLNALPDSIGHLASLKALSCDTNHLTSLPDSIGNLTNLEQLSCTSNLLTTLPEAIGNLSSLRNLRCQYNHFTAIPPALARLPNSCSGSFENNPLTLASTELFRQAVTAERALHPDHGPVFDFSIDDSHPLEEGVSAEESLIFWFKTFQQAFPAANHEAIWSARLKRFPMQPASAGAYSFLKFYEPLLSHPEKDNLRTFLVKLQQSDTYKNPRTQNNTIFRLDQILTSACEDPEFRVQFFLIIRDAVATCGDRTAWGFNELDTYWRLHCQAKNLDDLSVAKLLIGKARLQLLKQIAAQDVEERRANPSTTTGIDEIEVFLYYQVKLKETLHLPISSEGMLYPAMSDVTEATLHAARNKVQDETSTVEQIAALLSSSEVNAATLWEERMQKAYPARFDAINEEIMERVASMPEELSELQRQSQMKNLQEEQKARTRQLIRELSLVWVSEHWSELGF